MNKKSFILKKLSHCISIASIALSGAAVGQEKTNDTQGSLEEVVVTAQFVKQNLQDTPVAITAITSHTLEARGQLTVEEIGAQAPNVTLTTGGAFAGPSLIGFIRGVGQTDFNPALEPGVGLYVDDVYYSTLTGSVLDLLDLDRVEVLRGPQGTLAGKNSIGGAIKLYSKKPDAEDDGYVEVGYGTYDAISTRAATNFTLLPDKLFARIAGVSRTRDGHITSLDYGCTHPGSGYPSQIQGAGCEIGTQGGISYTAARAALRWLASDSLEVNFSADVLSDKSESPANVLLATGPTIAPIFSNVTGQAWPTVAGLPPFLINPNGGCQFIAFGSGSCDPSSPNDPYVNYSTFNDPRTGSNIKAEQTMDARGMSLNVDWQLNDNLQLQSITGYRKYESNFGTDPDGSPEPVLQLAQSLQHTQQSQEFRLNGELGMMEYTVGAFYFDAETIMDARVNLGYVGFDFIHGPDPVNSTTWALFGQSIVHFTDSLHLSLGVRYTDDEKEYTFARRNADLSPILPCLGPPGTPGNPSNCLISSLNGTTPPPFEDDRVDGRIALSWNINDDIMAYAQWSTGFKGGGINPRPFYNVQAVGFAPEELTAYEVGAKGQFMDNRLRLNGAIFFNDYTDIQLTLNECSALFGAQFGSPCLANTNAGDAEVKGAELEIDYVIASGLQIDASMSYLDFQFTKINSATGLDLDKVTPYTPEVKWSAGIQYEWQTSKGTITPRLDVSYQDDIYTAPNNTDIGKIDAYKLVNANITWRSPEDAWQVSLIGRNLADKLYYTSKTDALPGLGGAAYGAPALPRTYTLIVKHNF